MPSIRQSKRLAAFAATQLYQVPAGKSASVSVALVNPAKANIFVQTNALSELLALSAPTAEVIQATNHLSPATGLGLYASTTKAFRLIASSSTYADIAASESIPIGYRFSVATGLPSAAPVQLISSIGYILKSLPTLDYAADPAKTNMALVANGGGTRYFVRRADQYLSFTLSDLFTGYGTIANTAYSAAGGAGYDGVAISAGTAGYSSWFTNITETSITGSANGQFTSETSSPGSVYSIASEIGMTIQPGSPQIVFVGLIPHWWCSSFTTSGTPKMAMIPVSDIKTLQYNTGWKPNSTTSISGSNANERLRWFRTNGDNTRTYVGSSFGKIYKSDNFNAVHTEIATPPADVDVNHPPIRISATQMVFASLSGGNKYHVFTMGATDTWNQVSATGLVDTSLAATYAAAGITPVIDFQIGSRIADRRVWTATNRYDVVIPFDSRSTAADLVQGLTTNAERTNIVLAAGDRLFAYSETNDTIAHVYGFEE